MSSRSLTHSKERTNLFRIGVGAGFAGDRFDPAVDLIKFGDLDALVFECLAERTIGLAQLDVLTGTGQGFDPRIIARLGGTLPYALQRNTVLITNAGAASPVSAGRSVLELAERLDVGCRVGVVTGDDVLSSLKFSESCIAGEAGATLEKYADRIVSANAYMGAEGLVDALELDCDVVISGRVADAALFLAPLIHRYGWLPTDWDNLAQGSVVGHLLECAGQLTGGYFDDGEGGHKHVPRLARIGFPFADVDHSGRATFDKVSGTGGRLDRRTTMEQLLYEVTDPCAYITPDVVVDMSQVCIEEEPSKGTVSVYGATGFARPTELKVSVGVRDGWVGTSEISYSGHGCVRRASLAIEIVRERWNTVLGHGDTELECSLVGVNSCWPWQEPSGPEPSEVRARFAVRSMRRELPTDLISDVEALYTNGPAGGGGVISSITETIGIVSTFIPREEVEHRVQVLS